MRALLLALIDVPDALLEEFHAWYDTEHVPERLAVPGIGPVARWERLAGDLPHHLATYEAASADVLDSGSYSALKAAGDTPWSARLKPRFERVLRAVLHEAADYGGGGGSATACALALTDLPADAEQRYRHWYDDSHGPLVAGVPGVVRVRRYEGDGGAAHATLLELADPAVLASPAYAEAKAAAPGEDLRAVWSRRQATYALRSRTS